MEQHGEETENCWLLISIEKKVRLYLESYYIKVLEVQATICWSNLLQEAGYGKKFQHETNQNEMTPEADATLLLVKIWIFLRGGTLLRDK